MYSLIRKLLFLFEPETAHSITLSLLKIIHRLHLSFVFPKISRNPVTIGGIEFPNPVGIPAGFDKHAEAIDAVGDLGFGFIEIGTVTPKPQIGNPKPRLFRLIEDEALINRFGFNSVGLDKFIENLKNATYKGVLMISVTQNNDTPFEKAIDDYVLCVEKVYPYATIIDVNISCPNVPNKINFERSEKFPELLHALKSKRAELQKKYQKYVPLFIKISPDLEDANLSSLVTSLLHYQIDGVIATNTTKSRDSNLKSRDKNEKGGLSGKPLFPLTLKTVRKVNELSQGKLLIIAAGGIDSTEKAKQMFDAGASLMQVYTGLIYRGLDLVKEITEQQTLRKQHG